MNNLKLPSNWTNASLGDVCERPQYGWTTRASSTSGPYRLLRTSDISKGPIDWNTVPYCAEVPDNAERYVLRSGDVVISRAGSIGLSALVQHCPPAVFASYLVRFRPNRLIDPHYIAWFLHSPLYWSQLHTRAAGIALQNVNARNLQSIAIPLAPMAEQRRIVAAIEERLSDFDAATAGVELARAKLDRYRAAVLHAAVNGGLSGNRSPEGVLRKGWSWSTLGAVTEIQGGIQKQPKRAPVANHYPFLRVANVRRGQLVLDDVHRIELFGTELERLRLKTGDLLIVEGNGSPGEIGRMAVWDGSIPDCVHQNHIIRARPRSATQPEFLAIYWNSPQGMQLVQAAASSTTGLHTLSVAKVSRIPVPLPPLSEQQNIVAAVEHRLSLADRTLAEIDVQLARAAQLRRAILKDAFEGRLVPQRTSDEPATSLLDRIRDERAATLPGRARRRAIRP